MKRRQLIRYLSSSFLTATAITASSSWQSWSAQTNSDSLKIQWLGHTCFLFTGNGTTVLVNPFRPLGCTAGYPTPDVKADLVLISSFLLDEGAIEDLSTNPKILTQPGDYRFNNIKFQGISIPHDHEGGRRFGNNIAWRWTQGGINILHLGGASAPIGIEQKILMGSPDIVCIPVGGGPKAYNPEEAMQAIEVLKPKVIIPTQYLTAAADKSACDLVPVDEFLALTQNMDIRRLDGDVITIRPRDLPEEGTLIRVFNKESGVVG
ncbi:MAG: MBL fold metallo-hydrolase [Xenococcaceae cyanobacterium MO_188.B29]|nr:MBL fold metallo-hydrolase [Xenococcaceae cyanobacterium MO_188.B29]